MPARSPSRGSASGPRTVTFATRTRSTRSSWASWAAGARGARRGDSPRCWPAWRPKPRARSGGSGRPARRGDRLGGPRRRRLGLGDAGRDAVAVRRRGHGARPDRAAPRARRTRGSGGRARRVAVACVLLAVLLPVRVALSDASAPAHARRTRGGGLPKRRDDARSALEVRASRWQAHYVLGVCAAAEGRWGDGGGRCGQRAAGDRRNWLPRYGTAIALTARGKDGSGELRTALSLNPREPVLRASRGCHARGGRSPSVAARHAPPRCRSRAVARAISPRRTPGPRPTHCAIGRAGR